ncbi:type II toxin-antitoxin system HipA family toxin [Fibrella aquatilis]|uniref:HipA domain-containing protein n=1 Tax=Fibrella aquatilis TaxID=2817059 RepID=A0A939K2G6_9BACT|nr:HipA domain-containing protein [Fibrella aquatilis]MBO0934061.1 HipA domain-containing protein [Fibrella aquatilis]
MNLTVCPSLLLPNLRTYSPKARKLLFDGVNVSHTLPLLRREIRRGILLSTGQRVPRLSISGVQEKYGLVRQETVLRLPTGNEQTQYILKPVPIDLDNPTDVPANEHLTMQLASQVYGIVTAANGLIFFADGEVALLVRRFDITADGSKRRQEDFASLSGRTRQLAGPDFKYEGSYEQIARLIHQYLPAARVEIEKLFRLVLFNYLFSNGDAHLKNFSILETTDGDFLLSPAYDLINTSLHVHDSDMALKDGLFADDYTMPGSEVYGYHIFDDFLDFGLRIGMMEKRIRQQMAPFQQDQPLVRALIGRSFLSEDGKTTYLASYESRLKRLSYSFDKRL